MHDTITAGLFLHHGFLLKRMLLNLLHTCSNTERKVCFKLGSKKSSLHSCSTLIKGHHITSSQTKREINYAVTLFGFLISRLHLKVLS